MYSFRRLNECIYHIVKQNAEQLDEFDRRKARNKALMTRRTENRALLFSILHKSKIEDEWMILMGSSQIRVDEYNMVRSSR
ncbi:hypothetical protein COOONC_20504 [Cooperia oncophora]